MHGQKNIKFYNQIICSLPLTSQTPVQQIGTYTQADLTNMYRKYNRPKHILYCYN